MCIAIIAAAIAFAYLYGKERFYQWRYDKSHANPSVTTESQIDQIFDQLTMLNYNEMPNAVKKLTHSDKKPYKTILKNKRYVCLHRDDLFRKIVRDYRIKDFISKDQLYASTINTGTVYYTTLDKKVVKKFLQLLHELETQGYSTEAITLRSGHRHPKRNYLIGGASQSKHILGEAIDIEVGDINGDGKSTLQDKEIVLKILETKIIKNAGGIGLYPGTKAVHFDTRGYRARWNSYTPAITKNQGVK